jgi:hypothetical protein
MKGVMTPLMPGAEVSQTGTGDRFDPTPPRGRVQTSCVQSYLWPQCLSRVSVPPSHAVFGIPRELRSFILVGVEASSTHAVEDIDDAIEFVS